MNYTLWIQDIVRGTWSVSGNDSPQEVRGIDVGTGATAIYPILLASMEKRWHIVGTEIDDASFTCATSNIEANHLESRITIVSAQRQDAILFPLHEVVDGSAYHFTMCNPPFYCSSEEIKSLAKAKKLPPSAVCTGSATEMIYSGGGEAAFVGKMVEESTRFRRRCRWYTSMLGKLSSVEKVVQLLRSHHITNYAITEFVQGRTRRWAIAWTFFADKLPDSIARINVSSSHPLASYMPPRNTLLQPLPGLALTGVANTNSLLRNVLQSIHGAAVTDRAMDERPDSSRIYVLRAAQNTWSRNARRQRQRNGGPVESSGPPSSMEGGMACSVKIIQDQEFQTLAKREGRCQEAAWMGDLGELDEGYRMDVDDSSINQQPNPTNNAHPDNLTTQPTEERYSLCFQWSWGEDRAMFESFVSHVGRKVVDALSSSG